MFRPLYADNCRIKLGTFRHHVLELRGHLMPAFTSQVGPRQQSLGCWRVCCGNVRLFTAHLISMHVSGSLSISSRAALYLHVLSLESCAEFLEIYSMIIHQKSIVKTAIRRFLPATPTNYIRQRIVRTKITTNTTPSIIKVACIEGPIIS